MTAAKILEIKVQASKLQETLGMLAQTQSQLNAINRALEEATEETKKSGSTLSKAFDSVCKKMKDFALTIKKGVLGGLKDSLKVARNLVMALGAAAASAIAISSGAIQRDRESKDSKVSASQLRAYQYAQQQTGINESEFNLANLQAKIHDIGASGDFAAIGLKREDLVGLNGIDAMQKVIQAVIAKGGANMTDSEWTPIAQAVESLMGVSAERKHLFSDKTQKEFNKHYQWGIANGIDNETLKKGEQSWNKFKFTLESMGMELSALAMPHITKGLNKFTEAVKTFVNWLKGDAGKNASEILGKVITSMIDLGKVALPYFISGLNVLASVLDYINKNMNEGFIGGIVKGTKWILDQSAGRLGELTAQLMNKYGTHEGTVDYNAREFHHKDGKYEDTYFSSKKQTNRNTTANSPERAMAHLLNDYTHNKISQKEFEKRFTLQMNIKDKTSGGIKVDAQIASKQGGGY